MRKQIGWNKQQANKTSSFQKYFSVMIILVD